jgi:hypothetical protein
VAPCLIVVLWRGMSEDGLDMKTRRVDLMY